MIVKICGITSFEAAAVAEEAGADLIGFVFAPSRRQISVRQAAIIAQSVPRVGKVGVFVNSPLAEVQEIAEVCKLDFVQLHGEESPDYCRDVGIPVIKAFQVGVNFDISQIARYDAERILLDTLVDGQVGGTGKVFDWQQGAALIGEIQQPVLVAGGLTPDNVDQAIRLMNPQGVDVSGGVETGGSKDSEKIRQFIQAVRRSEELFKDAETHCS